MAKQAIEKLLGLTLAVSALLGCPSGILQPPVQKSPDGSPAPQIKRTPAPSKESPAPSVAPATPSVAPSSPLAGAIVVTGRVLAPSNVVASSGTPILSQNGVNILSQNGVNILSQN